MDASRKSVSKDRKETVSKLPSNQDIFGREAFNITQSSMIDNEKTPVLGSIEATPIITMPSPSNDKCLNT